MRNGNFKKTVLAVSLSFTVLVIVIVLILAFRQPPGTEPPPSPSPSPPVTASVKPNGNPTPSARPNYPDDIFGTPTGISSLTSDEPEAEPRVYPGAEDLVNGEKPPLYEPPPATPVPIYQNGSVTK